MVMDGADAVKVDLPGYAPEKRADGVTRHRVRVKGDKRKRISLPVGIRPGHPDFMEYYHAARRGVAWVPPEKPQHIERSISWLADLYLKDLEAMVEGGLRSPYTLRQRRSQLGRFCAAEARNGEYGRHSIDIDQAAFAHYHASLASTPGEADNVLKSLWAMYDFAQRRGLVKVNPIVGIRRYRISRGGATPWTSEDLRRFGAAHPLGTTAHLAMMMVLFAGPRRDDARILGRNHETIIEGQPFLCWQPQKKGSAPVEVPMMPPFFEATRAVSVIGPSYLLTDHGKPFRSAASLGNKMRQWCDDAGLKDRSMHGLRKALGARLADLGASNHEIMAVLAHSNPQTSSIYTRSAERRRMARTAMERLRGLKL